MLIEGKGQAKALLLRIVVIKQEHLSFMTLQQVLKDLMLCWNSPKKALFLLQEVTQGVDHLLVTSCYQDGLSGCFCIFIAER